MTIRERSDLQKKILELSNYFNTPQQKTEIKNVVEDLKKSTCERKNFEILRNLIIMLAMDETNVAEASSVSSKGQQECISCVFLDLVYVCLANNLFEKDHVHQIVRKILQIFSIQENFDAFPKYQVKRISTNSMIRTIQMCFYFVNFNLTDTLYLRLIILIVEVFASNETSLDSISRPVVIQMTESLILSLLKRTTEASSKDFGKSLQSLKNEYLHENTCDFVLKSHEDLNSLKASSLEDFRMECLDIEKCLHADLNSLNEAEDLFSNFETVDYGILFNWLYGAICIKKMYFSSYIINVIVKYPMIQDIPGFTSLLGRKFFDIIFLVLENTRSLPKSTNSLIFDSLIEVEARFDADAGIKNDFYLKISKLELFNEKVTDLEVEFIHNVLKIRSEKYHKMPPNNLILSNFDLLLVQTLNACIPIETKRIKEQILGIVKLIRNVKEISKKTIEIIFSHYNKNSVNIQIGLLIECLKSCVVNDFRSLFNVGLEMADKNNLAEICIQFKKYMKESWKIYFNRLFSGRESQKKTINTDDFKFLKKFGKSELVHFISGIHDGNVLCNEIFESTSSPYTNSKAICILSMLLGKISSFDAFLNLVRKFYNLNGASSEKEHLRLEGKTKDEDPNYAQKTDFNEAQQTETNDTTEKNTRADLSMSQQKEIDCTVKRNTKDKESLEYIKAPYIFGLIIKKYLDSKKEFKDNVNNYKLLMSFTRDFLNLSPNLNVLTKVHKIFHLEEAFFAEKFQIVEMIQSKHRNLLKENEIRLMFNICKQIVIVIQISDEKEKLIGSVFENTIRGVYRNFLHMEDQKYINVVLRQVEEMIFSHDYTFFALLDIIVDFLFLESLGKACSETFLLEFLSKLFLIENSEKIVKILEVFVKILNAERIDPFFANIVVQTSFVHFLSKTITKFQNLPSLKVVELAVECFKALAQRVEIKIIGEMLIQEDKNQSGVASLRPFQHYDGALTKMLLSRGQKIEMRSENAAHHIGQNKIELEILKAIGGDLEIDVLPLLSDCISQNLENDKHPAYLGKAALALNKIFLKSFKSVLSHTDSPYIIAAILNVIPMFYHSKDDLKDLSEVLKKFLVLDKNDVIDCFVKTCGNSKDGSFCLQILASWLSKDSKDTSLTLIDKISQGLIKSSLETKDELDGLIYFIEYSIQFSQSNEFLEPVLKVISKSDYIKSYLNHRKEESCGGASKSNHCNGTVFMDHKDENSQDGIVFSRVFHKLNEFTYKFIIDQLSLPVTEKRENVILEYFTFYIDLLIRFDNGQESYGLFLAIIQSKTNYRQLKFKSYEVLFRFLELNEVSKNTGANDQAYKPGTGHRLQVGRSLANALINEIKTKILYFTKKYLQEGSGTSMYLTVEMLYILKMMSKLQNIDMIRSIRLELNDLFIVKDNNQIVEHVRKLFKSMFLSEEQNVETK